VNHTFQASLRKSRPASIEDNVIDQGWVNWNF